MKSIDVHLILSQKVIDEHSILPRKISRRRSKFPLRNDIVVNLTIVNFAYFREACNLTFYIFLTDVLVSCAVKFVTISTITSTVTQHRTISVSSSRSQVFITVSKIDTNYSRFGNLSIFRIEHFAIVFLANHRYLIVSVARKRILGTETLGVQSLVVHRGVGWAWCGGKRRVTRVPGTNRRRSVTSRYRRTTCEESPGVPGAH